MTALGCVIHRGQRFHVLKCWREPFEAAADCRKTHEIRRRDRDFRVGDRLLLKEWNPADGTYTGRELVKLVTYMTEGGQFGLPNDLVVMSTRVIRWPDGTELPV